MRTWTPPNLPELPGEGSTPRLFNTATGRLEYPAISEGQATLYVCGITPYDATHLGHAFTYLAYDLLLRVWQDAGITTTYAQNITDIDDPLLERANETGVDWEKLADEQVALYRSDMFRVGMVPPDHFIAVTESIDAIAGAVRQLRDQGLAYAVPATDVDGDDLYFDTNAAEKASEWRLGDVAPYDRELMRELSAERGGDPEREGKRNTLDPLLWRAKRDGEPSWDTVVGSGRPGWHIECSVIATDALGDTFTVQGGGSDLIFPHHEYTAGHATALSGMPLAHLYSHAGLVGYKGHKMSKSRGNLVFVSKMLNGGASPAALRLSLLAHHYRAEWEWFDSELDTAVRRLEAWQAGLKRHSEEPARSEVVLQQLRAALANDLDTPVALAILDAALDTGVDDPDLIANAVETLLGVTL